MIEFYYMFVLDTTLFWSEIWFMPHMWRKCSVNEVGWVGNKKDEKVDESTFSSFGARSTQFTRDTCSLSSCYIRLPG